jgi:hypothetical protein
MESMVTLSLPISRQLPCADAQRGSSPLPTGLVYISEGIRRSRRAAPRRLTEPLKICAKHFTPHTHDASLCCPGQRAEESLRHVEERSRQAVERARSELASLRSQLELESQRDPTTPPTPSRTWRWQRRYEAPPSALTGLAGANGKRV